jgi:hypothetical protein
MNTQIYRIKPFTRAVIASGARQSSALVGPSGLLRRAAPRNDDAFLTRYRG